MQRLLALTAGVILIALGASAMWLAAGRGGPRPPRKMPATRVPAPSAEQVPAVLENGPATEQPPAASDDHRRILGVWRDGYQGQRTMTVREDGTATMVCELEGMNARLFTPVLHLNLRWQLAGGVMTRVIIDGEPADKVRFVVNLMGARSDEKLLLLTDAELHLLDADGKTEYHWTRVHELNGKDLR